MKSLKGILTIKREEYIMQNFVEEVSNLETHSPIFALDIGTRSVIGMIIQPEDNVSFTIKDITILEHKERSMLDGQIHDIIAVSETISKVKTKLEKKHGKLKKVAVAAAGRSLKTKRTKIIQDISGQPSLRKEDIKALELSAIQQAQKELLDEFKENDQLHYHCVGYSVVNYQLDQQVIGNLIDQRGKKVSVEVIATFLPRVVVDSLISSLNRADLEMSALTLEPIAAIHVLIPASMRKLNIAFVDIGAGTSDIAITQDGTVTAYGMVPVAGDEITEAISQAYLLDFPIAEKVKRNLSSSKEIKFTDVLGFEQSITSVDILQEIDTAIENLSRQIVEKIIELNGKNPQAVMLVGGASQTPLLTEKIASKLNLPLQRVAVRGADAIQHQLTWPKRSKKGPELVTPIGIGISSLEKPLQYLNLTVNDETVHLFEMKKITFGDALIAAGIPINKLYGKPGMAMSVTINGQLKMIPGKHGSLPNLFLNDQPATLETPVENGDSLNAIQGENGKDANFSIKEAIEFINIKPLQVEINGEIIKLDSLVEINEVRANTNTPIHDRDNINITNPESIKDVLDYAGYDYLPYSEQRIYFQFNGRRQSIPYIQKQLFLNDKVATLQDKITDGDTILLDSKTLPLPTIKDLLPNYQGDLLSINVSFNGEIVKINPPIQLLMNDQIVEEDTPILMDSKIEILKSGKEHYIFSDIFRLIDFNQKKPATATGYSILINGESAEFDAKIIDGDQLELYWE